MAQSFAGQAQGFGLAILTQIASSDWPDKFGLRKPMEKFLYKGSKTGFQIMTAAARQFGGGKSGSGKAVRLASTAERGVFDLSLSDEQQMVRDSLSAFAREVIRPAAHDADGNGSIPAELKAQAKDLGLVFYAVPEAMGGMAGEQTVTTQMLALEDLGYGDFSIAASLFSAVSVANALTRWGSADQQQRYLPAFAGENPPEAALAVTEAAPLFDPMKLSTTARNNGSGYVLNGEKAIVLNAADAELFLIAADTGSGVGLFIVEGGTPGLSLRALQGMGLKAAATHNLKLENVQVAAANRIPADSFDYQAFLDLGALAWCALAVGTAQAALDYVIDYCNDRVAFGEPISHRQAVAFMVADIGIETETMRLMTWRACALAEQGKPFHREAYLARALCAEKAMKIGTDSVQLLGGHGFTKEHPVERWYRDLRLLGVMHSGLHI
jgi:alkylation response protein AidB-like acyl-CoA dehydrogenase